MNSSPTQSSRIRHIEWTEDGVPFDVETGEALDLEDTEIAELAANRPRPIIHDRFTVEIALSKLTDIEVQITAAKTRLEIAERNIRTQIRRLEARRKWWEWLYKPAVIEVAKTLLKGKAKSVQLDNGKVAWITSRGTTRIRESAMPDAVAFVERHRPDAVKKSVTMTAVTETIDSLLNPLTGEAPSAAAKAEAARALQFLETVGAGEKVKITTGA